jgi:hypothetical protein
MLCWSCYFSGADAVLVLRVPLVALTSWHLLQMLASLLWLMGLTCERAQAPDAARGGVSDAVAKQ